MNARRNTHRHALLALLAALSLTACSTAPVTPTGGAAAANLMQQVDATLRQSAPDRRVSLRLAPDTITIGSALGLELKSEQPGYVYVFQLSSDGRELNLVFPNSLDGANHLPAGLAAQLPRPTWRLAARGPAGVSYLMAVVAQEPQDLMALPKSLKEGRIEIKGPYAASMAPLREVAP